MIVPMCWCNYLCRKMQECGCCVQDSDTRTKPVIRIVDNGDDVMDDSMLDAMLHISDEELADFSSDFDEDQLVEDDTTMCVKCISNLLFNFGLICAWFNSKKLFNSKMCRKADGYHLLFFLSLHSNMQDVFFPMF